MHIAVIQCGAVMGSHQEEPHGFGVVFGQHLTDGEKIAQALGHFFVVHPHKTVVHPKPCQGFATGTFALRNFVFVVGELQVCTTTVDIKALAQRVAAHGGTFDVPTRTPHAVVVPQGGTVPLGICGLARFGRFPQHEIQGIFLALKHRNAFARTQFVQRLARQLAVACELAHRKIHIAIGRLVGQALALEGTNQAHHLRHIFGGTRLQGGRLDVQLANVCVHGLHHFIGQRTDGDAPL